MPLRSISEPKIVKDNVSDPIKDKVPIIIPIIRDILPII